MTNFEKLRSMTAEEIAAIIEKMRTIWIGFACKSLGVAIAPTLTKTTMCRTVHVKSVL